MHFCCETTKYQDFWLQNIPISKSSRTFVEIDNKRRQLTRTIHIACECYSQSPLVLLCCGGGWVSAHKLDVPRELTWSQPVGALLGGGGQVFWYTYHDNRVHVTEAGGVEVRALDAAGPAGRVATIGRDSVPGRHLLRGGATTVAC